MEITTDVVNFFESIDYSLLIPVLAGFVGFMVVLKLKSLAECFSAYLSIKFDKDLRPGSTYRFSTSTGHKIGTLTRWDFKFTRFRFCDHYERIPNRDLADGRLAIVRIDPSEEIKIESGEIKS